MSVRIDREVSRKFFLYSNNNIYLSPDLILNEKIESESREKKDQGRNVEEDKKFSEIVVEKFEREIFPKECEALFKFLKDHDRHENAKCLYDLSVSEQIDKFIFIYSACTENSQHRLKLPTFEMPKNWEDMINNRKIDHKTRLLLEGVKFIKNKSIENEKEDSDHFFHFVRVYMAHFLDNRKKNLFYTFKFDREGFWELANSFVPGRSLLKLICQANEKQILKENLFNVYW